MILLLLLLAELPAQELEVPGMRLPDGTYYLSRIETGKNHNAGWVFLAEYLDTYVESSGEKLIFKKQMEVIYTRLPKAPEPGIKVDLYEKGYVNQSPAAVPIYESPRGDSKVLGEIPVWEGHFFSLFKEKGIGPREYPPMAPYFRELDRKELPLFILHKRDIKPDELDRAELWYKVSFRKITGYVLYIDITKFMSEDKYWANLDLNINGL